MSQRKNVHYIEEMNLAKLIQKDKRHFIQEQ
jgi:hypothetical protein